MNAREFQNNLYPLIQKKFRNHEVKNEWAAFSGQIYQYSPRVDIAVGPFNIGPNGNIAYQYNNLVNVKSTSSFLKKAFEFHVNNIDLNLYREIIHPEFQFLISKNENSRCFIAIEIENKNSKKHLMGSIVNAASLGRIGIGIAFSDNTMKTFLRVLNYLAFLRKVEKNTYDTTNFLVLSTSQIVSII